MSKNQLVHKIGSKLVEDIGGRKKDWAHLVLVGRIEDDAAQMTGFVYYENGDFESVSPRESSILELLTELRRTIAAVDNKQPWLSCLIRIDRDTGEINFEFEYDKAGRWFISVNNSKQRAMELNPVKR
jgi:hypothetical protein